MTKIVNCTPHSISILVDGETKTLEPSGIIPRVETTEIKADEIYCCDNNCKKGKAGRCGQNDPMLSCTRKLFSCVKQEKGEVIGLPDEEEGVFHLVSGMVFSASDRPDLLAPDTGKTAIRNEKGHIVSVTRLLRK